MPARRFIKNDPEEFAAYMKSLASGPVVFDGRSGSGKTYLANAMAKPIPRAAVDADAFLVRKQGQFIGALKPDGLRSAIEAAFRTAPLVVLSTVCGRQVVAQTKLQADAFVWIERTSLPQLAIALRDFADDYDADAPVDELRKEVEAYIKAYKAREQPDVVYLSESECCGPSRAASNTPLIRRIAMRAFAVLIALLSVPAFAADYTSWPGQERPPRYGGLHVVVRKIKSMDQLKSPVAPFSSNPAPKKDAVGEGLPASPGIEVWRTCNHASLKRQMLKSITKIASILRTRPSIVQSADGATTALIIDPGLLMAGGHAYSALLRVKAELSKLSVEHTCLASMTTADATVRKLATPVLPAKGLWWRSLYTRSEFLKHVKAMREQLSFALNDQTRLPDLLVLPCCDSVQISAVAEYYREPSPIPTPHLVLWLLLRPNLFKPMGDPSAVAQINEYREAFAALRRAIGDDSKITVVCETAALALAYSDITGLAVGVAPCPNVAGAGGKEIRRKKEAASRPTPRIVTLGHANMAKGYHLLPEAIKHVLDSGSRATFFIHGTLENTDATDGAAILDALSKMGPSVVTNNELLTSSEYQSRLLEADMLLLPYDSEIYETRGSGLFNEAREIGIPVVATRGCVFAQPAFDEGWGIEIAERSGAGIAQAILAALQRLPDLSARAEEAAAKYHPDDVGTILRKVVGRIRPDERSARAAAVSSVKRRVLPDAFFTSVSLQNGASIRDEASVNVTSSVSTQATGQQSAIATMMGRLVDTTPVPYHYSVVFNADARKARNLPIGSHIIAEISIEVIAGMVAAAWLDENGQVLESAQRYPSAMPGPQRLVVPVPVDRGRSLVFRNFASSSVPASFRILELTAMKWSPN
jgi:glycosyltransferase involved in cell wall biosynthesis